MTENLVVKTYRAIGLHKVCPYETSIRCTTGVVITHEAHLSASNIRAAQLSMDDPNQDVALLVWFSAASAVQRPSGSKVLVVGDDVFYVLTYTDVFGSGHGKRSELSRQRERRMICYLREVSNSEHKQAILDCIATAWGKIG